MTFHLILPVSLNLWHHAKCTAASAKLRQPFWKTSGWISTAKSNYRNPSRFPFVDSYWFNIHIKPWLSKLFSDLNAWLVFFKHGLSDLSDIDCIYGMFVCFCLSIPWNRLQVCIDGAGALAVPLNKRGWAEEHQPPNGEFIWDYIRVV